MFKKLILITTLLLSNASIAATQTVLTISIHGVSCPFCITVLIENVKKQAFTSDAKTSNDHKELIVSIKPGAKVDMDKLNKAIKDSGYEPIKTSQKDITSSKDASGEVFKGHVAIQSQPCNTCHAKK